MSDDQNNDPKTPPSGEPGKGTDPKNPDTNPGSAFDPSKLGDEDILKVLEDSRVWNTERLKGLRDSEKKLKQIEKDQADAEKKRLAEQGEYQKLSDQHAKERDEALTRSQQLEMQNQIIKEAAKKGVTDLDAATKLINSDSVKLGEDGQWSGITEAVDALVKDRPYLINSTTSVGSPTNPASPSGTPGSYTINQISDPAFYQANKDDILKAQREGRIVDDRHMPTSTAS